MSNLPPAPPPPRSVGPPPSPQPFAVPPPGAAPTVKPSGWWHVLGGVLMAVGVIGGLTIIGISAFRSLSEVEDYGRVSVPGEGVVSLDETGGYTLYHEFPGAADAADLFQSDNFGLTVEVTAPDGSEVSLERYTADVTYEWEDFEGVAVYSFRADEVGDYQIRAEGAIGEVAVGEGIGDIVDDALGGIVGGLLFGFVAFVGGLVLVIVTAVKRGRSRRSQLYGGGYGGGGAPGPTWGPGGYPPPGGQAPLGGPQPPGAYPPPGGAPPTWGPPPGSGPPPPA